MWREAIRQYMPLSPSFNEIEGGIHQNTLLMLSKSGILELMFYYIPLSIGQICFIAHELTCFDRSYCCYGLMNTGSELDFCHSWRCSVTKIKSLLVGFL